MCCGAEVFNRRVSSASGGTPKYSTAVDRHGTGGCAQSLQLAIRDELARENMQVAIAKIHAVVTYLCRCRCRCQCWWSAHVCTLVWDQGVELYGGKEYGGYDPWDTVGCRTLGPYPPRPSGGGAVGSGRERSTRAFCP